MTTRREHESAQGFAMVSAIFILVVLASLGAFIVVVTAAQHAGSALDLGGARAYYAARAGVQWGAAQTANAAFCAANPATTFIAVNALAVTVTCAAVAAGNVDEAGLGTIYLIAATACNQPAAGPCPGAAAGQNYVERRLSALLER